MDKKSIDELVSLKGKVAIVTGGAMGIGLGIVERLAEAGAKVLIADLNEDVGNDSVLDLKEKSFEVEFVQADVSKESDVVRVVDSAKMKFGRIDILVNNAGIYPIKPVMQMEVDEFEKILDVNLKSVFLFTKHVSREMIEQGQGGKIINITSIDALHPSSVGLAAYDASKHGLWGFTKNSALELAPHKISVNALAPGGIKTPGTGHNGDPNPKIEEITKKFIEKIPMGRMGEADDIGKVALFLASELSDYMTGTQVVVDGGVLLS